MFFFFKQKTAYEMRISDWSSDVCSSDLGVRRQAPAPPRRERHQPVGRLRLVVRPVDGRDGDDGRRQFRRCGERGAARRLCARGHSRLPPRWSELRDLRPRRQSVRRRLCDCLPLRHLWPRGLWRRAGALLMKARSDAEHRAKMKKIQAAQAKKVAAKTVEKGLVIVHTGPGKGKTSAALGMAVSAIGHGMKVGVVQFVKRTEAHMSELQSLMRITNAGV